MADTEVVREITNLQRHLEGRMEELRRMSSRNSQQGTEVRSYEGATEQCLRDFDKQVERLAALWAGDARTATQMKLRRFREQHRDLLADFKKLSRDRAARQNAANLVAGAAVGQRDAYTTREEEGLLRERQNLENSHFMIDEALEQATANREAIGRHNEMFQDMRSKMTRINAMFPNMDTLIGKIGTRKRFENLVLLATTALCILVILWYKCIRGG